jgi:tetratricopeptide (TPR) repeat protein
LAVALTYDPDDADTNYRMACWIEDDAEAPPERAGRYYRKALRAEPRNAEIWADYGAYLVAAGKQSAGRTALLRAARLAGSDTDLLSQVAGSLRKGGHWEDAQGLLRQARFAHPHDRRFIALEQQHQFAQLCADQQARPKAVAVRNNRPMLLPFVRRETETSSHEVDGKIIRMDPAAESDVPAPKRQSRSPRKRGAR